MGLVPEYDIKALEEGIEKAKKNIGVFEAACDKERETIKEYRRMISFLEEKMERESRK